MGKAVSHILQRNVNRVPPRAVSASGLTIRTADGHEVIDGFGGAAVACLGYGNQRVRAAILDQLDRIAYSHTSVFTSTPAEELADLLVGHAPGGLTHALFLSGGAEAMEAALKLTRQYFLEIGQPERTRFIARRQGFHGNTLGALGATSNPRMMAAFQPLLSDAFSHVSTPFAYHHQRPDENEDGYAKRLIAELEAEFQRLGPGNVAAFVAETVVGSTTGSVTAPSGYFAGVREVCHRYGALLILDEVMCGMGRTGTLNAWEQEGVPPDIQMNSKGLGGGYQPIAAIQIQGGIVDALKAGSGTLLHGHTYSGHPVACAAALEVQRIVAEENLLENVQAMSAVLFDRLDDRFGNHAHIGDIRGRGLFASVEFVADRGGKTPFAPELKLHARVKAKALALGLDCYAVGGTLDGKTGDHVMLAPAFIVTESQIDRIVAILGDAVDSVLADLPG
jgi:adenosylmethionine-8-amino-7-oxononanoate aminotransferase